MPPSSASRPSSCQIPPNQGDAVPTYSPDLHLAQVNAAQTLGRGQLAQMLDQAVDLLGRQLFTPAESAEDTLDDLALDPDALDDVDVLVGLGGVMAATDFDE